VPLELFLALRFLREGRAQTILIIAGSSFGVLLLVFLTALIGAVQQDLLSKTLGTQPHVVLRVPDEEARPLRRAGAGLEAGELSAARVERPAQRLRAVTGWSSLVADVARAPEVTAASPLASGPGLATRGGAQSAVALFGVVPEKFLSIYNVDQRLVAGRFDPSGDRVVIGQELASDLGIGVGDKLRLSGRPGRDDVFTVAGIFDLGVRDVNRRWVLVSLRAAQTLLDLPGGITQVDVRVRDPFRAEETAALLGPRTGMTAESWQKTNRELLAGLRGQSGSSQLIQTFVVLGVAVAIASVLIISVVQRQRQIGILRAMGTPRATVLRVFLIQGALVGVAGSVFGGLVGAAISLAFVKATAGGPDAQEYVLDLSAALFAKAAAVAIGTGLVAAVMPARRAARLLPAVAIRHE
jgi:lipoprotein-releasing system permease protein